MNDNSLPLSALDALSGVEDGVDSTETTLSMEVSETVLLTSACGRGTIRNPLGLHMRPATAFVQTARRFDGLVQVRTAGRQADGKSIMDLLLLGAVAGGEVEIEVRGRDAHTALAQLLAIVTADHDELGDDTGLPPKG